MNARSYMLRNRVSFQETTRGTVHFWYFSPASVCLYQALLRSLSTYLGSHALDVGAGQLPLRQLVRQHGAAYTSVDAERRHPDLDVLDDAQTLRRFEDNQFDTVICSQVLEHIPDPFAAMEAMARVLKPGGRLILTAPHLSRLHEIPNDYYRYTEFGLKAMATRAGLDVVEVTPAGGLLTFLGQQACTVWMSLAWGLPGLRTVAYRLNRIAIWIVLNVDRFIGCPRLFATTYLLVAQKPSTLPDSRGDQPPMSER